MIAAASRSIWPCAGYQETTFGGFLLLIQKVKQEFLRFVSLISVEILNVLTSLVEIIFTDSIQNASWTHFYNCFGHFPHDVWSDFWFKLQYAICVACTLFSAHQILIFRLVHVIILQAQSFATRINTAVSLGSYNDFPTLNQYQVLP